MQWSWVFLFFYVIIMLGIGLYTQKKIKHADDFATARGSYGPFFLALAFAASTASGATFLGTPALSYEWGLAAQWSNFLYPIGVYFGVLISMRLVASVGDRFGNRSIPEYLGDRYKSDGIRILVALLSLILFFYLAGQLVSGGSNIPTHVGPGRTLGIGDNHSGPSFLRRSWWRSRRYTHRRVAGSYDDSPCSDCNSLNSIRVWY